MLAPRETPTTTTAAARHPRAPVTAYTARGSFPTTALSDEDRERALDNLERDMVVQSTCRVRLSNWRTWNAFHLRWFGQDADPLPLTPATIQAVAAQMKEAHYRSFPGYLSAAREVHLEASHPWTDELERARKRSVASTQRGIGPARQCIEIPPQDIVGLRLGGEALHDYGPVNPTHWAVLCSFHMLRGAESACALATSLRVDCAAMSETFALAGSKTDPQATGNKRSWGCVCGGRAYRACPYHAALAIHADLVRRFGTHNGALPPGLPLFPTASGEWCSREGFVATVRHFADLLCLDPVDTLGRCTIGEHVWRVSGSRMLALARVPLPTIALMARWGSDVIMRYVELAPLATITDTFAQGTSGASASAAVPETSLIADAVLTKPEVAERETIADAALDPPLPPPPTARYALNSVTGVLHIIARRRAWGRTIPGRTNCGRDYRTHEYRQVSALATTYLRGGEDLPNTRCHSCAKAASWAALETVLDDASESE
jgi:hypothetical protein